MASAEAAESQWPAGQGKSKISGREFEVLTIYVAEGDLQGGAGVS